MLGGGIGCSRLAVPLARLLGPGELTLIINTGDDHWRYGLRICPDLDTNLYALAGLQDRERGWGLAGDTFRTMEQLRALGDDAWFSLGDLDLATHMLRTSTLGSGESLAASTRRLTDRLGVATTILPMTEGEVTTVVRTPSGEHAFEEWFVRREARDPVEGVRYEGIDAARACPGAIEAIEEAELVILGPSNPVSSLGPILELAGVRDALVERKRQGKPATAVSAVVNGVPITDEGEARRARCREAFLAARGVEHRPSAVAGMFADVVGSFVLDENDEDEGATIGALDLRVLTTDTVVRDAGAGDSLAAVVLGSVRS